MADKKDARLLDVLAATYSNVGEAESDLKAIREVYKTLGTSHNFDAAVISKNEKGKVKINERYEAGTRHASLKGLGFGLAAGLASALFPPIGIGAALAAGGAGGAAIGAVVGHVQTGMPRDDLKKIADLLYPSEAALIVVYETSLADQVKKNIKAVNRVVGKITDLTADQIAEEMRRISSAAAA
jgi:uncharacterized membrane protein